MRLVVLAPFFLSALAGCSASHAIVDAAATDAPNVLAPCATGGGVTRDCGWEIADHFSCTPGATVEVGCGTMCGLGTCTGDPMIRVCPGETECALATEITHDDDHCSMLCPLASFTCPPGGRYTILTGRFGGGTMPWSCDLAVR